MSIIQAGGTVVACKSYIDAEAGGGAGPQIDIVTDAQSFITTDTGDQIVQG